MNVTVERIADSQVRLEIAADQEEHSQAVDKAYRRLAREIAVPGFRKGKAPRLMIERVYGRELFIEEANRSLIDDLFRKAIEQESLIPVGDPEIDFIETEPLSFVVTIPVYPTVDPGDYTSVRIEPVDAAIEDSDVDEALEHLLVTKSPWIDPPEPRKPQEGDQVTVDIQVMDGEEVFLPRREDAIFVLGENDLLPELQVAIEALETGESTATDIIFEEDDDRVAADDPRRGKTLTYNVTLNGIKERDLLALDDDFAVTYGNAESLSELRERIYVNLHAERTVEARSEAVRAILDQLNELATLDIPASMIDDAVQARITRLASRLRYIGGSLEAILRRVNQTGDQLKEEIRPAAAKDLRASIILREIAEREGIEVTDADLQFEIDAITSEVPQPEKIREAYLKDNNLRSTLMNDLFDQRLTDRLIEIATEGRGAVLNGFVPPEPAAVEAEPPAAAPGSESSQFEETSSETDVSGSDEEPGDSGSKSGL